MAYDRLSVEFDDDGWVAFRLADTPGEQSRAEFQPPKGFALNDILEAARATGWVVDRQGGLWIEHQTGCTVLATFVLEMLYYFDAPNRPSKRLVRIKQAIDEWLGGENEGIRFSEWVCAWLDLMIRDDAQEEVLAAEDVWRSDLLQVDIGKHRERRLRQVLERFEAEPQPAEAAETGRMAPSQRSRRPAEQRRRDVRLIPPCSDASTRTPVCRERPP